jgi:hypothetical protein
MTDSEALRQHTPIVRYEATYRDYAEKYELLYGQVSDEERSGWRRCYVALVRAEGSPPPDDASPNPVP